MALTPFNSTLQLRKITFIGAGAALIAIIGYLLLKSDRKKEKTKKKSNDPKQILLQSFKNTENNDENVVNECFVEIPNENLKHELNVTANTMLDKTLDNTDGINNQEQAKDGINDKEIDVEEVDEDQNQTINNSKDSNETIIQRTIIEPDGDILPCSNVDEMKSNYNDKHSETSSDSGNGESDILISNCISHSPNENEVDDFDVNVNRQHQLSEENRSEIDTLSNNNDNDHENNNIDHNIIDINKTIPQSISSVSISSSHYGENDIIVYEFHFPRKFCGKLIGRNGVHVDYIRNKTHVQIAVRDDTDINELQIVSLSGYVCDVDQALDIISARFPARHYPNISFKPITKPIVYKRSLSNSTETAYQCDNKVLVSPTMYVQLPTANKINQIDVHVSAIVNVSHIFIQLTSNQTYSYLQSLDEDMLNLYGNNSECVPKLQPPYECGTICAAPTLYGWHRAMITNYFKPNDTNNDDDMVTVKFLDYGGYLDIRTNELKQLRTDFMYLPFQAIEVFLDGILPIEGHEEDGKNFFGKLIKDNQLKAIVTGYSEDYTPLIKLFRVKYDSYKSYLVNNELISLGYAQTIKF